MRIGGLFTLLFTGLSLASCASAPMAASAPDLSGAWYGKAQDRGLPLTLLLRVSRDADGHYSGTADSPNQTAFDLPITKFALDGSQLKAVIDDGDAGLALTGTVDDKGGQIRGQLTLGGRQVALDLQRRDPSSIEMQRPRSLFYEAAGHRIHYVQKDGPADVRVVFIHGTPGSWEGWGRYLGNEELQRRATLIAVDRPGFGDSKGDVVPDLHEQARLLEPLLRGPQASDSAKTVTTIVVGHSLGGPIAAELAMDYPQEVQGALLIAPSIDPLTETPRWYNKAMTWWAVDKLVTALLDPELRAANLELMPLDAQLKTMEPRFKSLPMPVTVIQGEKDELVDPRTADFAERVLPPGNRVIRVPDEGHFVLWEKPMIEVDALNGLLDHGATAANSQAHAAR